MNKVNSTEFVSPEVLAKGLQKLSLKDETYETGGVPLIVKEDEVYVDGSDSHTVIFGSTGSKKTRMFVMPAVEILSRAGESFFISDPKGEVYKKTAAGVSKRGYEICCLNLRDFANGRGWNPFSLPYELYHAGNKSKALELVGDIANALFKTNSENDVFWANTSINVMTGFILLMFEEADANSCNLKGLIGLWKEYRKNRKRFLSAIREKYLDSLIYTKLSAIDSSAEKTTGSIESYVDMGMNLLAVNEDFVDFLSVGDFDIHEMAEKKMATYLIVPDESEYYHFVVGLFVKQCYMVLIQKSQSEGGMLKRRMNFILDEFCNIPEIPEFSNMITAARSRNIRFNLIVQSIKQLSDKYGVKADVITGNCNNWIYLYSREMPLLSELSQLCGEVIYDNSMRMPLISTFELQHLDKEKGEALLLVGREKPCIARLLDIDAYPFQKYSLEEMGTDTETETIKNPATIPSVSLFEKTAGAKRYVNLQVKSEDPDLSSKGKRWLVATYADVIFDSKVVEKEDVDSGYAVLDMLKKNEILNRNKERIKWYEAGTVTERNYRDILESNPEFVYLTINELGQWRFSPLKDEDPSDDLDLNLLGSGGDLFWKTVKEDS